MLQGGLKTAHWLVGINKDLGGFRRTLVSYRDQTMCTHAMAAIICRNLGLLGRSFVLGQDASQIQRQQLLELSHNEDFAFGICFPKECHHASDYLERYVCSKERLFL